MRRRGSCGHARDAGCPRSSAHSHGSSAAGTSVSRGGVDAVELLAQPIGQARLPRPAGPPASARLAQLHHGGSSGRTRETRADRCAAHRPAPAHRGGRPWRRRRVNRSRNRSSCFGLRANTRKPCSRSASTKHPARRSIATAIVAAAAPVRARIHCSAACTAPAVCATARSPQTRPSRVDQANPCSSLPQSIPTNHSTCPSPPLLPLGRPVTRITLVLALAAQLPTGCHSRSTSPRRTSTAGARGAGRRGHSRQGGRASLIVIDKRRPWKLPEPWTPRPRPPLLGKRTARVFHSYHRPLSSINKWYKAGAASRRRHPTSGRIGAVIRVIRVDPWPCPKPSFSAAC